MYEIRKNGTVLALTEKPMYICLHPDGFYVLCDEAQAQGIAVSGQAYNLLGREPMVDNETVLILEKDMGVILREKASYPWDELYDAMKQGVNELDG